MIIADALELINELSADELRSLTRDGLMFIIDGMSPEDISRFLMEKNVKVFGSINAYVDDFLNKTAFVQGDIGKNILLNKMLEYPGISEENKTRIRAAINIITRTAPAAGGRRKKTNKRKRSSKKRN
jgi:small basic protein